MTRDNTIKSVFLVTEEESRILGVGKEHRTPRKLHIDLGKVWVGRYKAGFPSGVCWTALRGGGWMVGR